MRRRRSTRSSARARTAGPDANFLTEFVALSPKGPGVVLGEGALAERLGRDVSWAAIGETGADVPMAYAIPLEKMSLPQVEDIVAAVSRTTERKMYGVA